MSPVVDGVADGVLVEALGELLYTVDDDACHPLASLIAHMGDLLVAYDEANRPMPKGSGVEVLRYLMQEHCLFSEVSTL